MSALPPKADIAERNWDVRFVPKADISHYLHPAPRRFPPSIEEQDACFVVRDGNGQALAYIYFEDEPGRRSAAKSMT
jgi:hypothetical protein